MAHKEKFHLPSVTLEMEFEGDEGNYEVKEFRSLVKNGLMKKLVADGVAFRERLKSEHWKKGEGTVARVETVVDAWAAECGCKCAKEKDAQKGKVRWTLEGAERATILMVVSE